MDAHCLAELRSLAYHRAVAEQLRLDPALVAGARERVRRWRDEGKMHAFHADAWLAWLDAPPDVLRSFLVEDSERARELRQATPFTFVISPRERWAIWRSVKSVA